MCEFSVVCCWWYQFQTLWSHGYQGHDSEEGSEKLKHPLDLTLEESLAHLVRDFEMNAGERGKFFEYSPSIASFPGSPLTLTKNKKESLGTRLHQACQGHCVTELSYHSLISIMSLATYHCFWHFQRSRRRAVQEGSL